LKELNNEHSLTKPTCFTIFVGSMWQKLGPML
jgi:hypothetical protein